MNDNTLTKKISQYCSATRLEQIVTEATRVSSKSCTLIDHIYTNVSHRDSVGVINSNISDHLPVFMVINKSRNRPQFRQVYGRSYKDFDEGAFADDIRDIEYSSVFCSDDPERVWDLLYIKIYSVVDTHCPLKQLRITIGKPKYLTDRLLALMRERDKAFKNARSKNTPDTWLLARAFRSRVAR